MATLLRILLVEDSEADAALLLRELEKLPAAIRCERVDSREGMERALNESEWDAVVSDYMLPRFGALAALQVLQRRNLDVPFIIVSGAVGEDVAVAAMKAGADDYLSKDRLHRLVPAIERELREAVSRRDKRRAEEKVREQAALLDRARDAILVRDIDHRITYWNKGAERLYGWTLEEVLGRNANEIFQDSPPTQLDEAVHAVQAKGEWQGEFTQKRKDRSTIVVESHWSVIRNRNGSAQGWLIINTDVTDKRKIEKQFLRAQRLDGIGTLASGIAHDLNNILAPILMSAQIMRMRFNDDESQGLLNTVEKSAKRGAEIVQQLVTFARGSEADAVMIQPRLLIRDMLRLMEGSFPKNITIKSKVAADVWPLMGQLTHLHQILLNLCVNARDAMPKGGTLTISAENLHLRADYTKALPELSPGPFVVLKVTDTGCGMSQDIIGKIFDPFFTTKEEGKGTGLGLSIALGLVKSHKGFIDVFSEPGRGTTFEVFLPASPNGRLEGVQVPAARFFRGRGESILVVDDEAEIRKITRQILTNNGYTVLTAEDGARAVVLFAEHADEISAVITDICMPFLDGIALVRALKKMNPRVRVIASSGMSTASEQAELSALKIRHYLKKPYTAEELLHVLNQVLHNGTGSAHAA